MGAIVSALSTGRNTAVTKDVLAYCAPFSGAACKGDSPADAKTKRAGRSILWGSLDFNGNGHVSLAEVDKWILATLIGHHGEKDEGTRLWKLFRPSFIRAFKDAADIGKDKRVKGTKTATTDDYVQRGEFRCLLAYIMIYGLFWDAFNRMDGGSDGTTADDDRRLTYEEFKTGARKLKGHPIRALAGLANADEVGMKAAFSAADADGHGMVLLAEFCGFIEKQEKAMGTELGVLLGVGEDD